MAKVTSIALQRDLETLQSVDVKKYPDGLTDCPYCDELSNLFSDYLNGEWVKAIPIPEARAYPDYTHSDEEHFQVRVECANCGKKWSEYSKFKKVLVLLGR